MATLDKGFWTASDVFLDPATSPERRRELWASTFPFGLQQRPFTLGVASSSKISLAQRCVSVALASGVDINTQTVRHASHCRIKATILHDAVLAGHPELVEYLLAHGADPLVPFQRYRDSASRRPSRGLEKEVSAFDLLEPGPGFDEKRQVFAAWRARRSMQELLDATTAPAAVSL